MPSDEPLLLCTGLDDGEILHKHWCFSGDRSSTTNINRQSVTLRLLHRSRHRRQRRRRQHQLRLRGLQQKRHQHHPRQHQLLIDAVRGSDSTACKALTLIAKEGGLVVGSPRRCGVC